MPIYQMGIEGGILVNLGHKYKLTPSVSPNLPRPKQANAKIEPPMVEIFVQAAP